MCLGLLIIPTLTSTCYCLTCQCATWSSHCFFIYIHSISLFPSLPGPPSIFFYLLSNSCVLASLLYTYPILQKICRIAPSLPLLLCFLVTSSAGIFIGIIQCRGQGKGTITLMDKIIPLYIFNLEDELLMTHGPSDSDHTGNESTRFKVDFGRCCALDMVVLEITLALCASVQLCSSTTWLTHVFLMQWMLYAQSLYHTLQNIHH